MARPEGFEPPILCLEATRTLLPNLARGGATGAVSASWGNSPQPIFSLVFPDLVEFWRYFPQVALRFCDSAPISSPPIPVRQHKKFTYPNLEFSVSTSVKAGCRSPFRESLRKPSDGLLRLSNRGRYIELRDTAGRDASERRHSIVSIPGSRSLIWRLPRWALFRVT
jgi:hypothetical protein